MLTFNLLYDIIVEIKESEEIEYMCVIAVKPSGVEVDDLAKFWLQNCAAGNPDGAGIMYTDWENVHYHKGFMGPKALEKTLEYAEAIPSEYPVVFHYRIATHGQVNPGTTHPFPLFGDEGSVCATKGLASGALVHNGIISRMPKSAEFSDTQLLVKRINQIPNISVEQVPDILHLIGGGSYCVMSPTKVTLVGIFEEDNGWYFSNMSYKFSHAPSWDMEDYYYDLLSRKDDDTATEDIQEAECLICQRYYEIDSLYDDELGNLYCSDCAQIAEEDYGAVFQYVK